MPVPTNASALAVATANTPQRQLLLQSQPSSRHLL